MASTYYSVVTDIGIKKMLEAVQEGVKVNIRYMAVGDGGGRYYGPVPSMVALKNEVWRGEVGSCEISSESENVLIIECVMPSDVGGFTIREMAVFDSAGAMVAICNTPDTQKVRVTDGIVHELRLQMEVLLSNTDSVQLIVDPSVVMATKKDIQGIWAALNAPRCVYSQADETLHILTFGPTAGGPDGAGIYDAESETLHIFGAFQGGTGLLPGGGLGTGALPVASRDALGCVKAGDGLTVGRDGTLSVDPRASAEAAAGLVGEELGAVTGQDMAGLFAASTPEG